jgi:hypothetical protein
MRSLTLELFKLIYTLTGAGWFSYYLAIVLISVLDVFVLQGLALLVQDMWSTKAVMFLFHIPFVFGTGTVVFFVNLKLANTKMLEIVNLIKTRYTKILVYALVALLLLVYSSLLGKLF